MNHTVAAVDCGTNSLRLLIASSDGAGGLVEHDRRLELTRLGQGVDATRRFHPDALARTMTALEGYAAAIRAAGVDAVRFVATSAARDAENSAAFFDGVRDRLGVEAEIIPGAEEAALSFRGARSGVPGAQDPILVMDIGGGSTELVNGAADGITHAISLDMGSVRLRERFLHDDPPAPDQVEAARAFVDAELDGSGVDFGHVATVIGVAGTVTTLAGAHLRLRDYDRSQVHGHTMPAADIAALAEELLGLSIAATMERYPSIPAKRAEVICGGALILARIMARTAANSLTVSEADILDGIALGMLER